MILQNLTIIVRGPLPYNPKLFKSSEDPVNLIQFFIDQIFLKGNINIPVNKDVVIGYCFTDEVFDFNDVNQLKEAIALHYISDLDFDFKNPPYPIIKCDHTRISYESFNTLKEHYEVFANHYIVHLFIGYV